MLATTHNLFTTITLALGLVTLPVIATGGFPPVNSSPGACGVTPSDASCTAVFLACVNSRPSPSNPLASDACVAAASCYPGNPDSFLANLFCRVSGPSGNNPRSATIPRLSDAVYNRIASPNGQVTYSSYASWYIQQARTADPSITSIVDLAFVRESFDIMSAWTGFCSTGNIPKGNFLDWFQYFSTVQGPATTCGNLGTCPTTNIPYCIDLTNYCAGVDNSLDNPFSIPACVAAAFCWEDGINSFLQAMTCRYNIHFNTNRPAPVGTSIPALTSSIIPTSPMTQNDFLGFMNSRVAALPAAARRPSQDNLLNRWSLIVAWTNFCTTRTVPRNNLSDLLRYSAVKLTSITCTSQCPADPNASCQQLFEACINSPLNVVADPWSDINCVLATICRGRETFGEQLACVTGTPPVDMETYPPLTQDMFNRLSFGDDIISRQNFLDSYYGALARLPNPQWPDVNYVLAIWKVIEDRTGFFDGNIAYRYISEWLRWA